MAKQFTGIEGSTVPLADTIEAFTKICDGDYDHVAEQAFFTRHTPAVLACPADPWVCRAPG
jgi:F0F1-type ATP synthase beta subunit